MFPMAAHTVTLFLILLFLIISVNIKFIKCSTNSNSHHFKEMVLKDFCQISGQSMWTLETEEEEEDEQISTGLIVRSGFEHYNNTINDIDCRFTVESSSLDYALFAVVQSMNIEKNTKINGDCTNYIRFGTSPTGYKKNYREKHCGQYTYKSSRPIGIFDPEGVITTEISIHNLINSNPYQNFVIIFTSVKLCEEDDAIDNLKNIPGSSICMKEEYICDKIQNCYGFVCEDEGKNCEEKTKPPVSSCNCKDQHREREIANYLMPESHVITVICLFIVLILWSICCFFFGCLVNRSRNRKSIRQVAESRIVFGLEMEENIETSPPTVFYF